MFSFNKRVTFDRAEKLAALNSMPELIYAALEARFCIEAITYEKAKLYSTRLPENVIRRWQPPQLMKALLEFEPSAAQSFTLSVATEGARGSAVEPHVLGSHKFFRISDLQKIYNQLGSFLHAPTFQKQSDTHHVQKIEDELKKALSTLLPKLKEIASSTLDASIANVFNFDCTLCNTPITRNVDGLLTSPVAICLNSACQAEYFVDITVTPPTAVLKATLFDCQRCGKSMTVENRKLALGFEFKCKFCQAKYRIESRQWGYALATESIGATPGTEAK